MLIRVVTLTLTIAGVLLLYPAPSATPSSPVDAPPSQPSSNPEPLENKVSKWTCSCVVRNGGTQKYDACAQSENRAHFIANAKCEAKNKGFDACKCGDCHEVGFCE